MAKKPIRERSLTLPEVKKLLDSIGEENLDQFQRRSLDYASKFAKVDDAKAETIVDTLKTKFGLDEEEAIQIVNCMPESVEEIRVFLGGGRRIIETSKLQEILSFLDEHRK
jgi:DNA-directed RNA polymerase subunit F